MPGIDESIVVPNIALSPNAKPVKQKIRKMNHKVAFLVKVKIEKLLKDGFSAPSTIHPGSRKLSASSHALVTLLAQRDDEGRERAVYYIIRTLIDYESQSSTMEKQCLALVFETHKLRHYILHLEMQVIAKDDILKYLFAKSDLSGSLAKWVMLLSEFDLHFITQKSIKGQVISDQLADAPSTKSFPTLDLFLDEDILIIDQVSIWDKYFYRLRCQTGSGVGVVFISPKGKLVPLSFCLELHCANNIAKYEALIARLHPVIAMAIKNIHIHGYFELIIN
ncbi:uncharacterized protein LOC131859543 [Cryptomeria japonica]|uniref:uncharacterized protein LOC131859543 n=1 Tax=Cryptomeria japonica TaxID=3369 RepID=UPI0027DA0E1B|nr:uncharacterized protein LOC131859543 [Cryptomeria japonica]